MAIKALLNRKNKRTRARAVVRARSRRRSRRTARCRCPHARTIASWQDRSSLTALTLASSKRSSRLQKVRRRNRKKRVRRDLRRHPPDQPEDRALTIGGAERSGAERSYLGDCSTIP